MGGDFLEEKSRVVGPPLVARSDREPSDQIDAPDGQRGEQTTLVRSECRVEGLGPKSPRKSHSLLPQIGKARPARLSPRCKSANSENESGGELSFTLSDDEELAIRSTFV